MFYGLHSAGRISSRRAGNLLDGGAHFYRTYECADGKFVAVGAIEPRFYSLLLERCGIEDEALQSRQRDAAAWPDLSARLEALFRTRPRSHWCELLEGTDACLSPVLDWADAPAHEHNVARKTFVNIDGVVQPGAAPRFSRTPGLARPRPAQTAEQILRDWQAA